MAGVTAIETRAAAATVRVVEPLTEPDVAVIVVVPCATLVARPAPVPCATMVATATLDELQVTEAVKFCVLPSVNVPVAVNC